MRLRPDSRSLWPALALLAGMAVAAPDEPAADSWEDDWGAEEPVGQSLSGFVEAAGGTRADRDRQVGRRGTLLDLRWRLEAERQFGAVSAALKGDALYDGIDDDMEAEVRDLSLTFSPLASLDVKVGRQVLTWGTGDLVFLNDLFPKGWVGFFAGREDEYLKAPSNSVRMTQYNGIANIDFVWTPKFTPDDYIDGRRFSYFSPLTGGIVGSDPTLDVERPGSVSSNDEFALRLFRTHAGAEYALYAYRGFFKTPSRVTGPQSLGFAPMTSLGGSVRRPAGAGLLNAEISYYLSRDDRSGTDPLVANSQLRLLIGYEWEAVRNFNIGLQYYLERVLDHDALIARSPAPGFEPPENRHVLTTRFTYRTMQDKLTWSLFAFVSPNDRDAYLRPVVAFRFDDHWAATLGFNLFAGDDHHTFLGQFDGNSNGYARIRYNY
ncbi:MAG: hypothetical protein ACE5G3_10065 [Gammaproteobacteria bacterium]